MKIKFYPQRSDDSLTISILDGKVVVNGISYDLTPLPNPESIQLQCFKATNTGEELVLAFALPYSAESTIDIMQVYEVDVDESINGPVAVPGHEPVDYPEIQEAEIDWPDYTPPIPQKVTRRQARQALAVAGKLALVQPAIDSIPDPLQQSLAQIEWDDSTHFERDRSLLIQLAYSIGLSDADIDDLFVLANTL